MLVAVKKKYETPRLEQLATQQGMQKHRVHEIKSEDSDFDEMGDVNELLAEFGSPLYIVSEKSVRTLYRSFRDAFTAPGIDTIIGYSYKTNYLPAVCAIFQQEGAFAEVVSGMEYDLARSLNVPGHQIIFNGPYKQTHELIRAVTEGALINIDSYDELDALAKIAKQMKMTARIGLRINFQHGEQSWTKFGFNYDNGDAVEALKRVKKAGTCLSLEALHNHSGTYQVNPDIYARTAQVLTGVAKKVIELGMPPVRIADFGGGYPSSNRLKPAFESVELGGGAGRHLQPFADAIIGGLAKAGKAFGERPTLMLEPGRAVIDSAMKMACTVVSRKSIPGRGDAVIVDAGVNLLPTAYWYDHGVEASAFDDEAAVMGAQPVSVFGPLCMQIDVLRERAMLPPMSLGSSLVVSNVGAYCLTQSMQFIQPRPAVVLLGKNGPEVIRRRETREDIFALDSVPKHLKNKAPKA